MPKERPVIKIGMIGAGFLADMHARCYQRVHGYSAQIAAVAARSIDHAAAYGQLWNVPHAFVDYRRVLDLPEVDIVHIATPNALHQEIVVAAAKAAKHVVCPKPLTGYFGRPFDPPRVGQVAKRWMFERAAQSAFDMVESARRNRIKLMYA